MVCRQDEWQQVGNEIVQRIVSNPQSTREIFELQMRAGQNISLYTNEISSLELDQVEDVKLREILTCLYEFWLDYNKYELFWLIGCDFLSDYIKSRVGETLSEEEFNLLSTPLEQTFSSKEELAVLQLVADARQGKLSDSKIYELTEKYSGLTFGYDGPILNDFSHYKNLILKLSRDPEKKIEEKITKIRKQKQELAKKQEHLKSLRHTPKHLEELFHDLQLMAQMTDDRKKYLAPLHISYDKVLEVISGRLGIAKTDLKFLTTEEVVRICGGSQDLLVQIHRRKVSVFLYYCEDGELKIASGEGAEAIRSEVLLPPKLEEHLSGVVGSHGVNTIVRGVVKVLASPVECGKVVKGDIIVATMTTPQYTSAMRLAAAIITDEGGVTCHAAIIARELKIPAIIGTKIATKVLKDGDLVEVDVEKGAVKIIERAK